MNQTLSTWNQTGEAESLQAMLACCGARRWAAAMVALRPIAGVVELSEAADRIWSTMQEADWMEAFACHPAIGDRAAAGASRKSIAWSEQEQSSAAGAGASVLAELAAGNALYEQRFGFTYIVCATGKTAEEMLEILRRRLASERQSELREAAEQQRQITQIRLGKWLIE
ncbi:MAG TPA: 2-oxo-4-hydroxy-4-carboxy-5-ureidoimidazoline decarboxylase [Terracidiphilus sp.]|jgi:2-oxo-4-hydroxy-4-carboxy-5-ureidoimidazoline decarboxylase